jgi:hypothetical protein
MEEIKLFTIKCIIAASVGYTLGSLIGWIIFDCMNFSFN